MGYTVVEPHVLIRLSQHSHPSHSQSDWDSVWCNLTYSHWYAQLVESGEAGGYKMASAAVTGGAIYEQLKHESGVHRVQRVPVTETQGRVHTSAASIVVMPQADEVGRFSAGLIGLPGH